jgi:hypothetical protein
MLPWLAGHVTGGLLFGGALNLAGIGGDCRMTRDARIDLRIPRDWRIKLDEIAEEVGLSPSDLGRLAIRQFLQRRNLSLKIENDDQAGASR